MTVRLAAPGRAIVWGTLAFTLLLRLYWAATAPLANDEAYYWDWSRALQLSFLDHPPAVAWIAALGARLAPGLLGVRLLVPFLHVAAVLWLLAAARLLKGAELTRQELTGFLILTETVPAFSLEGVLLLPDSGLLTALAASLYFMLRGWTSRGGSGWWAVPAGVAFGVAGLCKYHAAPIAVGMAFGLLLVAARQGRRWEACTFLAGIALVALLTTLPVWWWNAQHAWASFRFQGAHGFAGLSLDPLAALRVYLGQLVILTPLVMLQSLVMICRPRRLSLKIIPIAAALPLMVLLEALAWGKQMLPHWLAPACWMLVPLLALHAWSQRWQRANLALALLVSWVLPWMLTVAPWREALVAAFHGTPGPLSELTLWQPLSSALTQDPRLAAYINATGGRDAASSSSCPQPVSLASLRWFWSAQLAFHLPGQPRVLSLDMNHPSYYSYRDDLTAYADCPVLVIGDQRHFDSQLLRRVLTDWQDMSIVIASHRDTHVIALLAHFRSRSDLATLRQDLGDSSNPAAF